MKARGPLGEEDKRRLVLKLVTQLRCAGCGTAYDLHDFALVERRPDAWVLNAQCRECGTSSHVVVLMSLEAESEPVMDLTPEELSLVDKLPPISGDDVLDVHQTLEEFDGDLDDLFSY